MTGENERKIVANNDPEIIINGVEIYTEDEHASDKVQNAASSFLEQSTISVDKFVVVESVYRDGKKTATVPLIKTERQDPAKDVQTTKWFIGWLDDQGIGNGEEEWKQGVELVRSSVTESEVGVREEGDFPDEEIKELALILRKEGLVKEDHVVIKSGECKVLRFSPDWAKEAERISDPFTVDGFSYVAFEKGEQVLVSGVREMTGIKKGAFDKAEKREIGDSVTVYSMESPVRFFA